MIYIKLYIKRPTKTIDIIKTKILGPDELLVWSKITVIEDWFFKRKKTEHYYYSTVEGMHPIATVNTSTMEGAPNDHVDLISNYFYSQSFRKEMFGVTPDYKAKISKLEVVK